MKKLLILTIVIIQFIVTPFLGAQTDGLVDFSPSWTLHDLAKSESIPVKQLAMELELELSEVREQSLSELGITNQDAGGAIKRYREGEKVMVSSIVIVGMLIVFVSLVVVAFLISLFKHLHIFKRTQSGRKVRSVKTSFGEITSQGDMSEQSIAAVVAAVFLHEEEVDSENRLLLTWKRATTSIWKTGGVMPNSSYFASRRSR